MQQLDHEISARQSNNEALNCIALWRGVVFRALCDLGKGASTNHIQDPKFAQCLNRRSAGSWFDENNENFRKVCSYAQIDFRKVLQQAEEVRNRVNKYLNRK